MIESMLTFFAIGTFGFWLLTFVLSVIFIMCVESDHRILPNLLVVGTILLYWKQLITLGWPCLLTAFIVYLIAGIAWSIFKWFRYVSETVEEYKEENGTQITKFEKDILESRITVSSGDNKNRILGWIIYWPWGIFWTLTGDLFNVIYDAMKSTYQNISNRGLSKFEVKEKD